MAKDTGGNSKGLQPSNIVMVRAHAEVHWYEAHEVGAKDYKIKRVLD